VLYARYVKLNALEMETKRYDVKVVIEGAATALIPKFANKTQAFTNLYTKFKNARLIDCVCKACAEKMGALQAALEQNLPFSPAILQ